MLFMPYKKITFLLSILSFMSILGKAQTLPINELNKNMQRFYRGCIVLREGIEQNNAITLDNAIELLDDDPLNPDRIELSNLHLECSDTLNECPMKGHMFYNADYAEFYKENMGLGTFKEDPECLRGIPSNCQIAHRAVKAHGRISYNIKMAGPCQIIVLAEVGGTVKANVQFPNGNKYIGLPFEKGSVSYIKWDMAMFPPEQIVLTIENTSNKDISCVIVSN